MLLNFCFFFLFNWRKHACHSAGDQTLSALLAVGDWASSELLPGAGGTRQEGRPKPEIGKLDNRYKAYYIGTGARLCQLKEEIGGIWFGKAGG